jgi:hypothetical protein
VSTSRLLSCPRTLREHVELTEGPGGLHREVLTAVPRLAGAVRRLVDEHVEFTRLVDDLLSRVSGHVHGDDVPDVRAMGVALLGRLVRHRQAGADLVYEAYEADTG